MMLGFAAMWLTVGEPAVAEKDVDRIQQISAAASRVFDIKPQHPPLGIQHMRAREVRRC